MIKHLSKIVTLLFLTFTLITANAQHRVYRGHNHNNHYSGLGWVVPAVIGGAIVYGITRQNEPAVVAQPPQPQVITVSCPPGTMPFNQYGWVRNQYNQWVQTNYVECK